MSFDLDKAMVLWWKLYSSVNKFKLDITVSYTVLSEKNSYCEKVGL